MTGLDQRIEGLGHEGAPRLMLAVGLLPGVSHGTDPDRLAVVSTLVASERQRRLRRAGRSGPPVAASRATARGTGSRLNGLEAVHDRRTRATTEGA